MSPVQTYAILAVAILCEVIGTTFLQQSQQFTRALPSLLTLLFYAAAFYFLSITLRTVPVGLAYAIWSGLGIVLISLFGAVFLRQTLDAPAILGLALIVSGVLVIHLFSRAAPH